MNSLIHMTPDTHHITQVLNDWNHLNTDDKNDIISLLYPELKKIAANQLHKNNRELTQCTTEVVNEAYFKLIKQNSSWKNRKHFYAIAATVMRRIIVDLTRKKISQKRGEGQHNLNIDDIIIAVPFHFTDWLMLNNALEELNKINPTLTSIVEMRAILGMNIEETANTLEISLSTVARHWKFIKAWLSDYLNQ